MVTRRNAAVIAFGVEGREYCVQRGAMRDRDRPPKNQRALQRDHPSADQN